MTFDGLADFSLYRVKLHGSNDTILLSGYANKKQPRLLGVRSIVDDLTARQTGVAVEHFLRKRIALHGPMVDGTLGD